MKTEKNIRVLVMLPESAVKKLDEDRKPLGLERATYIRSFILKNLKEHLRNKVR
jgi:hypothetical protein